MNPQYIQQQQQHQQQQQQSSYAGIQNPLAYGELNSNVPPNVLMNNPPHMHQTMPGPPPSNLPPPTSYSMNKSEGNPSQAPPNMSMPPLNQNNLTNKMQNMSLGNQQRPPSMPNYAPPPPEKHSSSNVNGYNSPLDPPLSAGQNQQNEQSGNIGPPPMGRNIQNQESSQPNLPPPQTANQPFPGPPHMATQQSGGPPPTIGHNYSTTPSNQLQQNQPNMLDTSPNVANSSRLPPMPQKNISGFPPTTGMTTQNITGPPMQAQQNLPSAIPPLHNFNSSQPHGHPNFPDITMPGQQNPGPPLSSNISGPPLPMQSKMTGPSMSMQQNYSGPPLSNQSNLTGPPLPNQSNLAGPPLPGPPPLHQSNIAGPPLSNQSNLTGPPPLHQSNMAGQTLMNQSNMAGPPISSQQNLSGPPLPGQQYTPLHSQQKMSGPPMMPGYPGQGNFSAPPLQRQQNLVGPSQPGLMGTAQGQYPGSPMSASQSAQNQMGYNRQQSPGSMPGGGNYQPGGYPPQNYQNPNDMYGSQRGPYQGGIPSAGGYQPSAEPQQGRRLDPDQMPSPIQVIEEDQRAKSGIFATSQQGQVPPLVTTKFLVQDQGNASPRYIRSTMYTVPTTNDIIKQTNVPFGLIINPMARIVEGEYEPPIVDMGDIGPVRCIRCKAYMSPFMQFVDAGRRFQCMFCKATTEVPTEYFQHLDHTGQRMDRYERPELMFGTYEFIATTDYCRKNTLPKPPAVIFVIDVSYNNVKSGLVNLLCSRMKSIIRNLPVDAFHTKSNMKVGFITYNNSVHFYNINPCLAQPQMMVVGDVQDVFMPLLDGFLCDAEESDAVIDSLMAQIPAMFADTRETETILAPAIQAGLEALKASECTGKLMVFHSSLPNAEAPGKLKLRDERKLLGTDKEKTVLAPQNNVYNNLAQECVNSGCTVDMFIFNNSYVDIATIGQISRLTGGEVNKYTYFQADIDGERLITDVVDIISRPIAFDAVMRVRTSTGVRATDFYGHFFMSNTTDMELAGIDCNKAVAIEIKHDDKLTDDEGVYIQAALLYTSCGGIRRLRIINLSLKTSSQMAELYRACDLDAIVNFFSKQSVFKLIELSPKAVKDSLVSRCANMLAAYRKNCATPSSAGQLILPECMKLLPLYMNCLLKNDALSGGSDMTIDDKSFLMQAVATMPVSLSVVYIYPRLLPLHDIDPRDPELPLLLRCSSDKIANDGAYLLENGIHMFLWLGLNLSKQWAQDVFGVPSVLQVDTDRTTLPVLDTPLNKRIHDIINTVRSDRHRCMRLTVIRQRDKLELVFRHFLVEDRGHDGSLSYIDFLCHMHKEIRMLLSQ